MACFYSVCKEDQWTRWCHMLLLSPERRNQSLGAAGIHFRWKWWGQQLGHKCFDLSGNQPGLGLVQNAGWGEIAWWDWTQVQNTGVRDPFHGLSALPKIRGTGSGPAALRGIRGTWDDVTSSKLAGRGTNDAELLWNTRDSIFVVGKCVGLDKYQ